MSCGVTVSANQRLQDLEKDIHQALEYLNDNVLLARAALVERFPTIAQLPDLDRRAERVRALLLQAIEAVRPPRRFGFGSFESRFYDLLTLRYVENRTIRQIMQELHLGRRQVYRNLAQAEERLALAIADNLEANDQVAREGSRAEAQTANPLALELAHLAQTPTEVDLVEVTREALSLLTPLAERRRVHLDCWLPPQPLLVLGDRVVLKQAIMGLISCTLQSACGTVRILVSERGNEGVLEVSFSADAPISTARLVDSERIAASQGGRCQFSFGDPTCCEVVLSLPLGQADSILLVEDNADTVALYRRYLAGTRWQLQVVPDPRDVLSVAARSQPRAIVLDIMMPEMDGWSLLQTLRAGPETAGIPVLVCSVVDDPELASALGADAYLKKPVSQEQFLSSLRQLVGC